MTIIRLKNSPKQSGDQDEQQQLFWDCELFKA
jgi:hypothetical protein